MAWMNMLRDGEEFDASLKKVQVSSTEEFLRGIQTIGSDFGSEADIKSMTAQVAWELYWNKFIRTTATVEQLKGMTNQ